MERAGESGGAGQVQGCKLEHNKRCGLSAKGRGSCRVEACNVEDNAEFGLLVRASSSHLTWTSLALLPK